MNKNILLTVTILLQVAVIKAVPEFRPLSHNQQLETAKKISKAVVDTILTLPFIDDFSGQPPYPNPNNWIDANVFVNRTYGLFPPTIGVATFDALDQNGRIYSDAPSGGAVFEADILTSNLIRLDSIFYPYPRALSPADSVILSFYFQPGGGMGNSWSGGQIGYIPAPEDRLIVECYDSELETWMPVWETMGMSLKQMCPICDSMQYPQQQKNFFNMAVIPINHTGFYTKNFQFRIKAYSSINPDLNTGGGQWHIDYVYLDANRTKNDNNFNDIGFVEVPQTMLNGYVEVPYNQFEPSSVKNTLPIIVTNLSPSALSCEYYSTITDIATGLEVSREPQSGIAGANIYPYEVNGYYTNPNISTRPQTYLFPDVDAGASEKEYEITRILKLSGEGSDIIATNDTVITRQKFGREYAFDDGSSEQCVGFSEPNNIVAGRFTLINPDTIAGLNICFNKSYNDQNNDAPFSIFIWTVNGDTLPDELVYDGSEVSTMVKYSNENNGFIKYYLQGEPLVLSAGTYFWGIEQRTTTFLNIGLDQNNNASPYTKYSYYNSVTMEHEWVDFFYYGAIMVRPVLGTPESSTNVEEKQIIENNQMSVNPNPAKDKTTLFFSKNNNGIAQIKITDLNGRLVSVERKKIINSKVEISLRSFLKGLYIINATVNNKTYNAKIIIAQ